MFSILLTDHTFDLAVRSTEVFNFRVAQVRNLTRSAETFCEAVEARTDRDILTSSIVEFRASVTPSGPFSAEDARKCC